MSEVPRRHLSCIMFTDMVGYSALAQREEPLALELVAEQRTLFRPLFAEHGGQEIKSTGDGFLVEFASALDAVRCAVGLQQTIVERNAKLIPEKRFQVRVGLHLGDIEVQEGDVYGDGVNVAARVQQSAPAGSVCISGTVADAVRNKIEHPLELMGARRLKNIASPVELYRVVLPWERRSRWASAVAGVRRRAREMAIGVLVVVTAIGLAWAGWRDTRPGSAAEVRSLAVLPLGDLSPDPSGEYFADGMTEALIGGLSKIGSLRVISRTSAMHYRGSEKRLPEIARELDVDAVLEGSVVRAGDRVRISVRLVHAPSEQALWSETYERDLSDILALQDEVARAVAAEVEAELTPDEAARLADSRRVDPRAYEAYLRGRYEWNTRTREGLEKALQHFRQAIGFDPTWARGYAGLADAYLTLGDNGFWPPGDAYPSARAAALRAIELDEKLAEPHATMALIMHDHEWDWAGSDREFQRALDLDPNYAPAWQWYAWTLLTQGRMEEALRAVRRAREIDPLSPRINANVGQVLYMARDYEAAEREAKKSMAIEPLGSLWVLGGVYVQQRRFDEATDALEELVRRAGTGMASAYLAHAYAVGGRRSEAHRIVESLEKLDRSEFFDPTRMAIAYTGLGDIDRAFSWLETGYRERALFADQLQTEPRLEPLRSDPRFEDLLRRMGLEPAVGRP